MKHFEHTKTVEELKLRYKELAKVIHPDMGGSAEEFMALLEEYNEKLEELTSVPLFLNDEYIGLGKALCGIAKERKPEAFEKASTAAKGLSMLLSLSDKKAAKDICTFIDKLEL